MPGGRWLVPFVTGLVLLLFVAGLLEGALAARGFRATVVDSPALWARERLRASEEGRHALILVGASRAQLDVDLGALAEMTGKQPVQLAIDGSSYVSVLADLAADDRVTGTVLVDYQGGVPDPNYQDASMRYVEYWRHSERLGATYDFVRMENALAAWRQGILRSYADGAGPLAALVSRVLAPRATPQYLVTLPGRSRDADYSRVPMPAFYYQRVMRNAGIEGLPSLPDYAAVDKALAERIRALPQASTANLTENAGLLGQMVRRIEARGGKVVFVMFPRSGLVRAADDVIYPRAVFWDRIVPLAGGKGLYYADEPSLRDFTCPDGSHLDVRDKRRFTVALAKALEARGWISVGT
jgi:hypothetical protein